MSTLPISARGRLGVDRLRNEQRSQQRRAIDLTETAASPAPVSGKFMINNAGEAKVDITFPVFFSDIPYVTFGFEIQGANQIISGHAPAMSATVYDWDTIDRPPFSRFYKGAYIVVVSTGPPGTKFICTWTAMGTAFTSPTVGDL